MCTGVEIALLASAAAGVAGQQMQNQAAEDRQNAEIEANNSVTLDFMRQNQKLEDEANNVLQNRLRQEQQPVEQQAQSFKENRQSAAQDLSANIGDVLAPLRGSAPRVVKQNAETQLAEADARSEQERTSLAGARSYGDLIFNKGLQTSNAAQQLGTVRGIVQSNADLLPTQQQLAISQVQDTGEELDFGGQILSGLGSLGAAGAGSGAFDGLLSSNSNLAPRTSPVPVKRDDVQKEGHGRPPLRFNLSVG